MTWLVKVALGRPYTFIVMALMILIFGPLAAIRTPTDIFPNIGIPVVGEGQRVAVERDQQQPCRKHREEQGGEGPAPRKRLLLRVAQSLLRPAVHLAGSSLGCHPRWPTNRSAPPPSR